MQFLEWDYQIYPKLVMNWFFSQLLQQFWERYTFSEEKDGSVRCGMKIKRNWNENSASCYYHCKKGLKTLTLIKNSLNCLITSKFLHCLKSVYIRSYSVPHFSHIFPHSDSRRRDTEYLSLLSPNPYLSLNMGKMRKKCGPV